MCERRAMSLVICVANGPNLLTLIAPLLSLMEPPARSPGVVCVGSSKESALKLLESPVEKVGQESRNAQS